VTRLVPSAFEPRGARPPPARNPCARLWSARHAAVIERLYARFAAAVALPAPLVGRIGYGGFERTFRAFMAKAWDMGLDQQCFILAGVGSLASARAARWMRDNVVGVHIREEIIARLEGAAGQKAEGRRIRVEMIQARREEPGVVGVLVMAYRQSRTVAEIAAESGILRGRAPWRRCFVPNVQPVESLEWG
jgi:hypothetical protein